MDSLVKDYVLVPPEAAEASAAAENQLSDAIDKVQSATDRNRAVHEKLKCFKPYLEMLLRQCNQCPPRIQSAPSHLGDGSSQPSSLICESCKCDAEKSDIAFCAIASQTSIVTDGIPEELRKAKEDLSRSESDNKLLKERIRDLEAQRALEAGSNRRLNEQRHADEQTIADLRDQIEAYTQQIKICKDDFQAERDDKQYYQRRLEELQRRTD